MSLVLSPLIESTKHVFILRYTTVATLCFVAYEYAINFDFEVRFLWLRRFNIGFVLLFLCRYLPIAQIFVSAYAYVWTADLRPSHCSDLMKANTSMIYLQFVLSEVVLFTRAYAVWAGNKRILAVLLGTYIGGVAFTAYTIVKYDRGVSVLGLRIFNGCIFLLTDHTIFYSLIMHVVMDTLALSLLLYKSVQHARFIKSMAGGSSKTSLLTVMAQDGLAYYFLNLFCTVANMIVLERFPDDLHDFLFTTQSCIQNVLCSRLYFHIQQVNEGWTGVSSPPPTGSGTSASTASSDDVEMKAVARLRRLDKQGYERGRVWSDIKFAESMDMAQSTIV